jgi:hypothetical protein
MNRGPEKVRIFPHASAAVSSQGLIGPAKMLKQTDRRDYCGDREMEEHGVPRSRKECMGTVRRGDVRRGCEPLKEMDLGERAKPSSPARLLTKTR